jgi:hypothetical protein
MMMGQRAGGHEQLFYAFNLDIHVPQDHLLRGIERFLDLHNLRQSLAGYTATRGDPPLILS